MQKTSPTFVIQLMILILLLTGFPRLSFAIESDPTISIKLMKDIGNSTELSVGIEGTFKLKENGKFIEGGSAYTIRAEHNGLVMYQENQAIYRGTSLSIVPDVYGEASIIRINQRPYIGEMRFELDNGLFIRPISTLLLEDYLKGVVPFEMPASWELEALKAQAIAARTYAMRNIHRLIDDTTNFQVYGGYQWQEKSTRAVNETKGQVLQYDGAFVEALYTSSNGGQTEASGSLWGAVSYLLSKTDPFDPQNVWSLNIQRKQIDLTGKDLYKPEIWWEHTKELNPVITNTIKGWLQQNGFENHDLKVVSITNLSFNHQKTAGNRITKGNIALEFMAKKQQGDYVRNIDGSVKIILWERSEIPATSLRKMLGGETAFKSYLIDSLQSDSNNITIQGRGYGHGVGMSQYGANEMAKKGIKVKDIVGFYYPGTMLSKGEGLSEHIFDTIPELISPPIFPDETLVSLVTDLKLSSPDFTMGSNERISIQYQLQQPAEVYIRIYDEKGTVRRVLQNGSNQSAGQKQVFWDGYGIGQGLYNVVVEAKNETGIASATEKIKFNPKTNARSNTAFKDASVKSTVIVGLRPQPSFSAKPTQLLKNGDRVQVVGKEDRWYKIKAGASIGYIPDDFILLKR